MQRSSPFSTSVLPMLPLLTVRHAPRSSSLLAQPADPLPIRFLRPAKAHALAPTILPPRQSRGTRLLLHHNLCSLHARGSFGTRRVTPAPKSRLATQPRRPSLARGEQFRRALVSSLCARCVPAVSSDHRISRAPCRFTHAVVSSNVPPGTGMPRSGRNSDTSFPAPQALLYTASRDRAPAISRSSVPCPAVSRIPAAPTTPTRPHLLVCSNQATKRTSGAVGAVGQPLHASACPRLPRCLNGSAAVGKPSSLTWRCRSSAVSDLSA